MIMIEYLILDIEFICLFFSLMIKFGTYSYVGVGGFYGYVVFKIVCVFFVY